MNNTLISIAISTFALSAAAATQQEEVKPYILPQAMAQKTSLDGKTVVAQDYYGNAIVFDAVNETADFYPEYMPGNGNCVAADGTLVGQSMYGFASIMRGGNVYEPESLEVDGGSAFNGITDDGSRICGWVTNPAGPVSQVPFICDMAADGSVGSPVILPYPEKDFFGDTPQFCTAVWISIDGATVIGQVMDGTGFYSYPIVYTLDDSGTWNYSLPSEPLFNPDGLPIPVWPEFNGYEPKITDFMEPDKAREWEEDMKAWQESHDPDMDPWQILDYYITDEKYDEFEAAIVKYNQELWEFYDEIDEYWDLMSQLSKDAFFALGVMALNPQGTILATSYAELMEDAGGTDEVSDYIPYVFDLSSGNIRKISTPQRMLIPTQVLSDGSILATSIADYRAFLLEPDADDFISMEEYLKGAFPAYLPWLEDNLSIRTQVYDPETGRYVTKEAVMTGLVSASDDMTVIAGGLPGDAMMTYIYGMHQEEAEVEEIIPATEEGRYTVYNLQGVRILDTADATRLHTLPSGLYIINGKKAAL